VVPSIPVLIALVLSLIVTLLSEVCILLKCTVHLSTVKFGITHVRKNDLTFKTQWYSFI